MIKIFIILFFVFSIPAFAFAQSSDSTISDDTLRTHKISVLSNFENARIYLDTTFIGTTPLQDYSLKEGSYILRVFNPRSLKNWDAENQSIALNLNNDTTIIVPFRYFYFFNTTPFDAGVFHKDSLIGKTPLRFFNNEQLEGTLTFRKKNYRNYVYNLSSYDFETGANITLQPKGTETVNDLVYKNRGTQFNTKRAIIPIIGLAASSIAGGYFAVNFKNKANDAYDIYLNNGSNESLEESQRNDRFFVVSLVLMQAAIGGLIYFLFFD